jgi:hypothetical protein
MICVMYSIYLCDVRVVCRLSFLITFVRLSAHGMAWQASGSGYTPARDIGFVEKSGGKIRHSVVSKVAGGSVQARLQGTCRCHTGTIRYDDAVYVLVGMTDSMMQLG